MQWNDLMEILLKLLLVVLLVFLNGFFVAAEFALVKIRDTQLSPLIDQGHRRARVARRIVGNLDAFLSAAQLGITLASLGLGWVGEPVFAALLNPLLDFFRVDSENLRHTLAVLVGFSAITFLHITAGEQAPKWMAIQHALPTTLWVAYPMLWFYKISYPMIWILNRSSLWMLQRVGIRPVSESETAHSEEELRVLFAHSQQRLAGTDLGKAIVLNALDLRRRVAREVMRPRQEIVFLDTEASLAQCLEVAEKSRFSRFPLCQQGNLDRTLGVVHLKDLFAMRLKARQGSDLLPAARKLIYIPQTARLETLLQLFLDRKLHLAIVVDEFGGTAGMVTLENILEELVGQIQDEFDQENPLVSRTGDTTWTLTGTLPLHELEALIGQPLQEEGLTTTSGWITHRLEQFPKVGDTLQIGNCQIRVEEMDDHRVRRLTLTRLSPPAAD